VPAGALLIALSTIVFVQLVPQKLSAKAEVDKNKKK